MLPKIYKTSYGITSVDFDRETDTTIEATLNEYTHVEFSLCIKFQRFSFWIFQELHEPTIHIIDTFWELCKTLHPTNILALWGKIVWAELQYFGTWNGRYETILMSMQFASFFSSVRSMVFAYFHIVYLIRAVYSCVVPSIWREYRWTTKTTTKNTFPWFCLLFGLSEWNVGQQISKPAIINLSIKSKDSLCIINYH